MSNNTFDLLLRSKYHGEIIVTLSSDEDNDYFSIPSGKELVYNDNEYTFCIVGNPIVPSKIIVNDDEYDIEPILSNPHGVDMCFYLKDSSHQTCKLPFLNSFGAIKIGLEIGGKCYYSKSIAVMVSNSDINNNVMNMIQYIYDNCEKYLYEEHEHSAISTGIKEDEIISLEAKIAYLDKALKVFKETYPYFTVNPYSKLRMTEEIGSFENLHTISANTVRYIAVHTDELVAVNYDTGIRYNKMFYQPTRTLIEHNTRTFDVYENQIVVGFLHTIVKEITQLVKELQERIYTPNKSLVRNGYIDSMYHIFSRSINKLNRYSVKLLSMRDEFKQLYFYYSKVLNLKGATVNHVPKFTPVFQTINAYRQIYQIIFEWFSCGNYNLGKEELLLSFISTSKIYEYYCLVKFLCYMEINLRYKLISSQRVSYSNANRFYVNTNHNNKFIFQNNKALLTLYFQPVIYNNDKATNGIRIFRNTSTNCKSNANSRGSTYTPDYLLKIEYVDHTEYLIMDAKFSTPDNIRQHSLQNLVYKYLFSISPLDKKDSIKGLYIICGKSSVNDKLNTVHDYASDINKKIEPFAEIVTMGGLDTENYYIPSVIIKSNVQL